MDNILSCISCLIFKEMGKWLDKTEDSVLITSSNKSYEIHSRTFSFVLYYVIDHLPKVAVRFYQYQRHNFTLYVF
jgi:hypothetical protein